jgi:hypothetical protein
LVGKLAQIEEVKQEIDALIEQQKQHIINGTTSTTTTTATTTTSTTPTPTATIASKGPSVRGGNEKDQPEESKAQKRKRSAPSDVESDGEEAEKAKEVNPYKRQAVAYNEI